MAPRRSLLVGLALATFLLLPAIASADRFVDPGGPTFLSTGTEFVAFGGFVYFAADDGVVGRELWRTDGTAAGTTLVKDFRVGPASASGSPSGFRVVADRLFFNASNDTPTDGTSVVYVIDAGGALQKATFAGGTANGPLLGAVNGKVLLRQLENMNTNYGLYALGAAGTTFTKISSGVDNIGSEEVAVLGGKAYFDSATGANSATEPWSTDGTPGGTSVLKEVRPGVEGSGPRDFLATTERVYFTADDGTHGRELWSTTGTEAGTALVYEHHPLSTGTGFQDDAQVNGDTLYYLPDDPGTGGEVWRTKGTAATTSVVSDITPGPGGSGQMQLFPFRTGFGLLRGSDVYASDGTAPGTALLGAVEGDGYGPGRPLVAGERAYFRGGFSPFGGAVWRTDGTATGTFALTAGPFAASPNGAPLAGPFVQLGSKVIFPSSFPIPAGSPISAASRRLYVIDTTQPDETRRATTPPAIAGTPAVGQKLTGSQGSWTLEPNSFTFGWLRDGAPIPNVTGKEYTPSTADAGARISFRVTARGLGAPNVLSVESAGVTIGGATTAPPGTTPPGTAPPTASTPPATATLPALGLRRSARLQGEARVGKRLTLRIPTFRQTGVRLTIRWYAAGKRIAGQSRTTLTLRGGTTGKRITARVTATRSGYRTRTLTAGPTARVKPRRR